MKCSRKDIIILSIGVIISMFLAYVIQTGMKKPAIINTKDPQITKFVDYKEQDFSIGNKDADVKVVFYGDFTCHHCMRFMNENFIRLRDEYILTGKIQFIFRPFITTKSSLFGSQYLMCNTNKDDYVKSYMLNTMFEDKWMMKKDYANALLAIVRKEGWSTDDEVIKCVSSTKLRDYLFEQNNIAYEKLNIKSTPAIFVNYNHATADGSIFKMIDKFLKIK